MAKKSTDNVSTEKHAGGRPPKWETVEELQKGIDDYFDTTGKEEWTVTGLALHLDTSRDVVLDYQEKDGFSYAIKKAKLKVENSYELDLKKSGRTGTIFAMKNFGWKDKTEVENTGKPTTVINQPFKKEEIKEMSNLIIKGINGESKS